MNDGKKQPYKIFASNWIFGVGQAFIIVAIDDNCMTGPVPQMNYKAVEYYVLHVYAGQLKKINGQKLDFSDIPEDIISCDSLVEQALNLAEPEANMFIHEQRDSLAQKGLPYNAEFEFVESSLGALLVTAARDSFCDKVLKIGMQTSNNTLRAMLSAIRFKCQNWTVGQNEIEL